MTRSTNPLEQYLGTIFVKRPSAQEFGFDEGIFTFEDHRIMWRMANDFFGVQRALEDYMWQKMNELR